MHIFRPSNTACQMTHKSGWKFWDFDYKSEVKLRRKKPYVFESLWKKRKTHQVQGKVAHELTGVFKDFLTEESCVDGRASSSWFHGKIKFYATNRIGRGTDKFVCFGDSPRVQLCEFLRFCPELLDNSCLMCGASFECELTKSARLRFRLLPRSVRFHKALVGTSCYSLDGRKKQACCSA